MTKHGDRKGLVLTKDADVRMIEHQVEDMWNLTPSQAIELQEVLRRKVQIMPLSLPVNYVAGCDIAYDKDSPRGYAGIVVLALPGLEIVEWSSEIGEVSFPYTPGLLSFRECPLLLSAWRRLRTTPNAVMLDGHGVAHPRRFGLASHFGVMVDKPSLGCAKTAFVGDFECPGEAAGSYECIVDEHEVVGAVVRTRDRTAPIYVSAGHMIDLADSIDLVLRCVRGFANSSNLAGRKRGSKYRLPEPTRLANIFVNALRRGETGEAALSSAAESPNKPTPRPGSGNGF